MRKFLLILFATITNILSAQVKGIIKDTKGNPLSAVTIYLENSTTGTTSNNEGHFNLRISKTGNYAIVFRYLGYKTQKKRVKIRKFPCQLDIVLQVEAIVLNKGLAVMNGNPANEIIKKTISAKEKNIDKFKSYTANFYSKGTYRIKNVPKKFWVHNLRSFYGDLNSTRNGISYLSETISKIYFNKRSQNFKEKIIASKVCGIDNGINFNKAKDAYIDFYTNKIKVLNELVSPIADNAFSYYNYTLEGSFYDHEKRLINKIKIVPKRKNTPTFKGFIYIVENQWTIYGINVFTTDIQLNLGLVDTLQLKQCFNYISKTKAWVLINQQLNFKLDMLGFHLNGKYTSNYSKYDFKPNSTKKTFKNKELHFPKNTIKKDSTYWKNMRQVPLNKEEVEECNIRDRISVVGSSKKYLNALDTVQNKFTLIDLIKGYTFRNPYKKWAINLDGLIDNFSFNTVQGFNTSIGVQFFKKHDGKGKWHEFGTKINYGFSDNRVRPLLYFNKNWNNITRPKLSFVAGVTTQQFNERKPILKLNNTLNSLFFRSNYMKIFEKDFAKISFSQEIQNGVYFSTSLEYAGRKPLFNSTNYYFSNFWNKKPYSSNDPVDKNNFTKATFKSHKIATFNIGATFIFDQKYASIKGNKLNLENSKFPSLDINYRKRFGAIKHKLNSDLFTTNIRQKFATRSYGNFTYHLRGGFFLKEKNLAFMDNLQPNGNQLFFPIDHELNSFNLLRYYRFFTNNKTAEAHFEQNFKGTILNKIPVINQLNFNLVVGAKCLVMDTISPYTEYSIGLENIGFGKWSVFRFDYVNSFYRGIQETGFVFAWKFF